MIIYFINKTSGQSFFKKSTWLNIYERRESKMLILYLMSYFIFCPYKFSRKKNLKLRCLSNTGKK
jgi:hypothetical protein